MKIYFLFILFEINAICVAQKNRADVQRIQNYVQFLNDKEKVSAKEYILKQFEKYDIVILAERYHNEKTQYALINDVVNDPYFVSKVGNICIEIGGENLSDSLNYYLKNNDDTFIEGETALLDFQRNISCYPLWARESYHSFLRNIFLLNKTLNTWQRINLYLTDIPFDWSKISNATEYWKAKVQNRDSVMAKNISVHYEEIKNCARNKMLVILNECHAITNFKWQDYWRPLKRKCAGQYLAAKYGTDKIASICINSVATNKDDADILIQKGYWDAAFSIAAEYDTGFDFSNSPFGKDTFDYALGKNNDQFKYEDIFTGFVFYLPITLHQLSEGVENLVPITFRDEFLRRIKICDGDKFYETLKKDLILVGWNKEKYHYYDNLVEKEKTIENLKKQNLYNEENKIFDK